MFDVSSDEKLNILPHKGFVDSMEFFPFIKHTLTLTKVTDSVWRLYYFKLLDQIQTF